MCQRRFVRVHRRCLERWGCAGHEDWPDQRIPGAEERIPIRKRGDVDVAASCQGALHVPPEQSGRSRGHTPGQVQRHR